MFASRTNWPLEPNRFAQALEAHRRSGRKLHDLTASNPTTCGFSYPENEILAALSDRRAFEYHPEAKGLLDTRAAIADYYRGRHGFNGPGQSGIAATNTGTLPVRPVFAADDGSIDPERIFLTTSTSEAYTYLFRLLCEPGDEILVPAPSYPLFEFLADLADARLVSYPLLYDHGWQIDLQGLRAAITPRSRAILVVHPNNPTGSFVKPKEAAELAALCALRKMAIVSDEVFLDYRANAGQAPSFAFEDAALTFTLSGLSKIVLLPQMKLAWLVVNGPQPLARQAIDRLEVIADTYLSPSTPIQLAAPAFLRLRENLQAQLQQRIAANLTHLDGALRGGSLTRLEREGGWYAILRAPASTDDESAAVDLLERHSVLVHPGHFFNFSHDGYLVLSLIAPEPEFVEGVKRIRSFFAE
jgi:aspartate/methionine/tyrosine aminotransferase